MATTAAAAPPPQASNNVRPAPNDVHPSKRNKGKKPGQQDSAQKLVTEKIALLERKTADDEQGENHSLTEGKKSWRHLTRDLPPVNSNSVKSHEIRFDAINLKLHNLCVEMQRTRRELQKAKSHSESIQKEKDAARSDLTKVTSTKDKLEKLCREMQKDNKKLKDDNRRLSETETRMREDLHDRLEGMVHDVQEFVVSKESPEALPENVESDELFREKFKSFVDQYELRELQFHSLLRTKELEIQFSNARYEQQRRAQEQEANKSRHLTSQVSTFSQTETELRSQLNIYVDKFKQVEDTLNNSNDLFLTFRREMEEMSKKTKRLEKENHNLTRRHQATSENILQMAEERQRAARDLDSLRRKNENLERLCRGMQAQGRGMNASPAGSAQRQNSASTAKHAIANGQADADLDPTLLEEAGTESSYEYDDEDSEGESDGADQQRESALQNLESSPTEADPGLAEALVDPHDGGDPSVLQAAARAADLRSALAATNVQRARMRRAAHGQRPPSPAPSSASSSKATKHVNGQRKATG